MRRKRSEERQIDPDPLYQNRMLAKFINMVMEDGKKALAQKLVYRALDRIEEQGHDPLEVFEQAVENVRPSMEVRPRRVGGAAYQVPMPVKGRRQASLALRWLIGAARSRSNSQFHTFDEKLADELLAASQGGGGAMQKKSDVLRMAEANKAFAHFRW